MMDSTRARAGSISRRRTKGVLWAAAGLAAIAIGAHALGRRRPGPEARYRLERLDRGTIRHDVTAPGTVFAVAHDLAHVQVSVSVPESDMDGVAVGEIATFRVAAGPERIVSGTVSDVRPASGEKDQVKHEVLVDVDNRDRTLRMGMEALVSIEVDRRESVLRLPSPALTYVPAGVPPTEPALPHEGRVFVLDHGRPRPVRITVGVQDPRHAEVVAGPLDEGDAVIVGEYGVPPSEAGVPRR